MSELLVPLVPPRSRLAMEQLAEEFVKEWDDNLLTDPGPFPVFDAFDGLPDKYPDLTTGTDHLQPGVEGECWPDGRVYLSERTYLQLIDNDGRARFTTIHEICHGLHHRRYLKQVLVETGGVKLFRRSVVGQFEIGFPRAGRRCLSGRLESGYEEAPQATPGREPARQADR